MQSFENINPFCTNIAADFDVEITISAVNLDQNFWDRKLDFGGFGNIAQRLTFIVDDQPVIFRP
jgi:hypothetical protein